MAIAPLHRVRVESALHALREYGAPKDSSQTPEDGLLAGKTCDRSEQSEAFHLNFRSSARVERWPQVYLVRGAESECPRSLVERLIHTYIRKYALNVSDERQGPIIHAPIEWQYSGALADRRQILIERLFTQINEKYVDSHDSQPGAFSAEAFAGLGAWPDKSVIVFRHGILAERWDKMTKKLIEGYLQFWDEVGLAKRFLDQTRFIIFLIISYPMGEVFNKETIEKELKKIGKARQPSKTPRQTCPTLLLDELTCVKQFYVKQWFERQSISEAHWESAFQRMKFADGSDCRPMADIERVLEDILNKRKER
jgi:hypothetical protein